MDVRSHRAILARAINLAGADWASAQRDALLRGNEDEDAHIVPILGWRLRSIGLTHTYRPGRRFGELGAPSALKVGRRFYAKARALWLVEPARAATLIGRVCHLLVDTAVPARTRGVWHLRGDPLEEWIESRAGEIERLEGVEPPAAASPEVLFESLAAISARFPADTTRTPWGALCYAAGRGVRLSEVEVAEQAALLVPAAVGHVIALLRGL